MLDLVKDVLPSCPKAGDPTLVDLRDNLYRIYLSNLLSIRTATPDTIDIAKGRLYGIEEAIQVLADVIKARYNDE